MTDRVTVVTGAAGGIGKAIARAFSEVGDAVYILDVDEKMGEETIRSLSKGTLIRCDVTSPEDVGDAMQTVAAEVGHIDVLVNNAGGFTQQKTTEDTTPVEWQQTLDLNLTSVFLTTKAAIPLLKKSASGRIINISSLAGQLASYRTAPAYAAAKAGVEGLTRVLATELAPHRITVNALSPSAVETDRILQLRDEAERSATAASIPLGRYQTPDEVAAWVLFLASDNASFTTGQTIPVNGGRFMP